MLDAAITIYFGLAGALTAFVSLWHLGFYLRHHTWNKVNIGFAEISTVPGWAMCSVFGVVSIICLWVAFAL